MNCLPLLFAPGARGTKTGASADSGCACLGLVADAVVGAAVAEAAVVVGAEGAEVWEPELVFVLVALALVVCLPLSEATPADMLRRIYLTEYSIASPHSDWCPVCILYPLNKAVTLSNSFCQYLLRLSLAHLHGLHATDTN